MTRSLQSVFIHLTLLLYLTGANTARAQKSTAADSSVSHWSVLVGIGPTYTSRTPTLFAAMGEVTYKQQWWGVGIRYLYGNQGSPDILPNQSINDIALIGEAVYSQRLYTLSIGAGVGYESFVNRGKYLYRSFDLSLGDNASYYEELHSHAITLPLQADAFWTPSPVFGLGFTLFDNINVTESNLGFLFTVYFRVF